MAKKQLEEQLKKLVQWHDNWEDATAEARKLSERDRDYYDGKQWTAAEKETLRKRGQPCITINRIARKVNSILGYEIDTRVDPKARPRNPSADQDSEIMTDALRYVCDAAKFDRVRSQFADSMLIEGYGGAVVEVAKKGEDLDVTLRSVPWDRLWYDPHSREADFSDASYRGTILWMDYDDALARYPRKEAVLDAAIAEGANNTHEDRPKAWGHSKRRRVKVSEAYWYKGGECLVAHYTKAGFLEEPKPTNYLDPQTGVSECPLVMASAYVDRDNNRYGVVRAWIDPQDEINKRRSKAMHQLSTNQIIAEENAVESPQSAGQAAAAPDGYIKVRDGALAENRFMIRTNTELAQGQFNLLAEAKAEIDAVGPDAQVISGVDPSGRAIQMQQQQGQRELSKVFDNMRGLTLDIYEQIWHRIRQFWTGEKWIRVRDDEERSGFKFIGLNKKVSRRDRLRELIDAGMPATSAMAAVGVTDKALSELAGPLQAEAQAAAQQGQEMSPAAMEAKVLEMVMASPAMAEEIPANMVAEVDVDVTLDAQPNVATVQQEEFAKLSDAIGSGAFAALDPVFLLEVMVEAGDFRSKRKILDRLKAQQEPDANAAKIAEMQAQLQKVQAMAVEAQAMALQAQAAESMADAELAKAKATETLAKAATHEEQAEAKADRDAAQAAKFAAEAGAALVS